MTERDAAFDDWIDRARKMSVRGELARRGLWSKTMAGDNGVPCPGCGGADRFAVNTKKNVWLCRRSGEGGDAIALAMHIDGSNFLAAVETVTGEPPPGRASALTAAERELMRARAEALRKAEAAKRLESEQSSDRFREWERRAAWRVWKSAAPIQGTLAERYLQLRGLRAPGGAKLRFHPRQGFWDKPQPQGGRVIHEGPALVAAIEGPDGRFAGIQRIWLDLAQPKGKALIVHPETGEILKAKKTRGSVKGGTVFLARQAVASDFPGDQSPPARLFLGEGIETVLSVYCALAEAGSVLLAGAEFRAAVDLGNMAGKAAGRVKHPSETRSDAKGRVRPVFVPNSEPKDDPDFPLIPIAETVSELWLLGDGDSEPFFTRLALERAGRRFARAYPHLTIRLAMAAEGKDFNDMRREAAE